MRYSSLIIALSVSTMLCAPAFAQEIKGMHKHDASIASYNYQVPIAATTSGGGSLKDDLDRGVIDDQGNKTVGDATEAMPGSTQPLQAPNAAPIQPIAVGSKAPNFNLARAMGGFHTLNGMLEKGPALVMFTRHIGAPYSFQQLQLLQKNVSQFQQLGIQIVAITPEPLDRLQSAQGRYNFGFDVLSDPNGQVARQYGILQITEPTPALFSVTQTGQIAAIQLQPQMNAVFDLTEAAAPLRPQLVATPSATEAPPAEIKGVLPAVPSPQTKTAPPAAIAPQGGAMAPRVNYVPPSNPDFTHADEQVSKSI